MFIKKFINKILKRKQISIAGISKFDIDQNRLHKYENYNENEIKNHYYNWWNDTAKASQSWRGWCCPRECQVSGSSRTLRRTSCTSPRPNCGKKASKKGQKK